MTSSEVSTWQTVADVSTALGVVIALAGVIVTFILTLRSEKLTREGQELDRQVAESSASRSEVAAALTEEYTRRAVDALEEIAKRGLGPGGAEPAPKGVRWTLTHFDGDTYKIENVGDRLARDVQVAAHESMMLRSPEPQAIPPGEAVTFMAARSFGTSDSTITVQWYEDGDGVERSWRYPLPPRPQRR